MVGAIGIEKARIVSPAAVAPAEVVFAVDESVYTTIYYDNETGEDQVRDVLTALGSYDPSTREFSAEAGIVVGEDVTFSMGTGKTYTSGTWYIPDIPEGTYDVLVALGTYNRAEGTFTPNRGEAAVKVDYLTVRGVAYVSITDFAVTKA